MLSAARHRRERAQNEQDTRNIATNTSLIYISLSTGWVKLNWTAARILRSVRCRQSIHIAEPRASYAVARGVARRSRVCSIGAWGRGVSLSFTCCSKGLVFVGVCKPCSESAPCICVVTSRADDAKSELFAKVLDAPMQCIRCALLSSLVSSMLCHPGLRTSRSVVARHKPWFAQLVFGCLLSGFEPWALKSSLRYATLRSG